MTTQEKLTSYVESLKQQHKQLHAIVEALEAEKAPSKMITLRKKEKLEIKDKIAQIIRENNL